MSEIFYVIVGEKMKEKTSLYNDIKSVERWKPGHHEIQTHEDGIRTIYMYNYCGNVDLSITYQWIKDYARHTNL